MQSLGFKEIWALDFEFRALPGERPETHCLVAHELLSGRVVRVWLGGAPAPTTPPFDIGEHTLCVAFFSSAEWSCFLALGWDLPVHVLDLFVEFRNLTNGIPPLHGHGLLGALLYYGLPTMLAEEKQAMRELAMRGGPFASSESSALMDYCEDDVRALEILLPRMLAGLDMPRALLRGRYMKAGARMEATGIPIDTELHAKLTVNWEFIKRGLMDSTNEEFSVFTNGHFSHARFASWLVARGISWPVTEKSGRLALDKDTFRQMAQIYPELLTLQQTLHALGQLRLNDLHIGRDGRNRTLLAPFRSRTSRNQPSNASYVFGLAAWLRGLIRPEPGYAIVYLDWSQQEFGIVAALSRDERMMEAYRSGDPYLAFAKQAGAVPADGTKKTHKETREQFKTCALGVQFDMGAASLAIRIKQSPAHARLLLDLHHRLYPTYWKWSDAAVEFAMLNGWIQTVLGWRQRVGPDAKPRSLRNFPSQANGAEMLRLAAIFGTERGVSVGGPVHDALLVVAPVGRIDHDVAVMQEAMEDASKVILGGFPLRTDEEPKIIYHPDRYVDERGAKTWTTVMDLMKRLPQGR
jgi:hypothetical protein